MGRLVMYMQRIKQGQQGIHIEQEALHGVSFRSSLTISGVTARAPWATGNKGIPLRSTGAWTAGSTANRSKPEITTPKGFRSLAASRFAVSKTSSSRLHAYAS
jgi:hypothetical protein